MPYYDDLLTLFQTVLSFQYDANDKVCYVEQNIFSREIQFHLIIATVVATSNIFIGLK